MFLGSFSFRKYNIGFGEKKNTGEHAPHTVERGHAQLKKRVLEVARSLGIQVTVDEDIS